ncbi:hypothetical protein EJB05_50167, partial [Eragrostis curvula]
MARASDAAVVAIFSAIAAVLLVGSLDHQLPAPAYTEAPTTLRGKVQVPLAETATVAFFASAGYVFRHLPHAAAAGRNRRLSEVVTFSLCASAGVLQYVLFVQPPEGVAINIDVRALGLAAARALPAAAALTFFLGMALVMVQVRAGRGGRGGVAGDGAVQGAVWILSNVALGAAAAVVGMMAVVLYTV